MIAEAAPPVTSDQLAASLRDITDSLRSIQMELVQFRKMIFRLVFWPLLLSIVVGVLLWWSAANEQRKLDKLLEKNLGGGGDMNKLLKDLGF